MTNAAALSEDRYSAEYLDKLADEAEAAEEAIWAARYAAANLEKEFYAAVEKAPEGIRSTVEAMAFENSFAAEVYKEYDNDIERWEVAIGCLAMILDAPSDYGL
jgi:predicted  nucleic acid-binding Zn-ribbon protein